ncbi:hypothetical protein AGDE_10544 [Angomonas deanei]|uniref:Uncharacterized protein n=1 Tax=Angomonas deanei TaxID=59799 RepID=A0A7G2CN70_9TRYP|nr:hypothetical protein AGDE_10544 [Angomonas deanei]CAD2220023.1 hypothetical protein, conserved [Angomonas deanei]|eukprot:EPY28113.1 hypothetical protein AGDE_10544 [Angomonas deanei]
MTQKLLMAEALDLLHQCEVKEYDVDRTRARVGNNSKNHAEVVRLYKSYDDLYHQYVRGIEILNYVRHTAMDDKDPNNAGYNQNLCNFCVQKMTPYMDRCDNIQKKMDSVLLPIDQVDLIGMEGRVAEETLYIQDGSNFPMTRKESRLAKEFTVADGTYVLIVKNKDDYTLASPTVEVKLTVTPQRGSGAEPTRLSQSLPCQCAWRKVLGTVGSTTLQFEITSNGMRDSHIDVLLQRWSSAEDIGSRPPPTEYTFDLNLNTVVSPNRVQTPSNANSSAPSGSPQQWVNQLPPLPDDELSTLANYNVPKDSLPPRNNTVGNTQPDPWAALEGLNVPYKGSGQRSGSAIYTVPEAIEVNPPTLNCEQRLQRVNNMLGAWPGDGCVAAALPKDTQMVLQRIYALPFPRELS